MDTKKLSDIMGTRDFGLVGILGLVVVFGLFFSRSMGKVLAYDPTPWLLVVAFTLGTFVLVGPVRWALYATLSESTRETIKSYGLSGILITAPVVVPAAILLFLVSTDFVSAAFLSIDSRLLGDTAIVGFILGTCVVVVLEYFYVFDRVDGLGQ